MYRSSLEQQNRHIDIIDFRHGRLGAVSIETVGKDEANRLWDASFDVVNNNLEGRHSSASTIQFDNTLQALLESPGCEIFEVKR